MLHGVLFKNYKTELYGISLFKSLEEATEALKTLKYYWTQIDLGKISECVYMRLTSKYFYFSYSVVEDVILSTIYNKMKVHCQILKNGKVIEGITNITVINSDEYVNIFAYEEMERRAIEHKQLSNFSKEEFLKLISSES